MAVIFPIYNKWNRLFFEESIEEMPVPIGDTTHKRYVRYRKDFEFKVKLPLYLKEGDIVYIYEPKKHGGKGQIVGQFTAGPMVACGAPFGAFSFIVHFCRHILKNEEYANKFEKAVNTSLPGYKLGTVLKYALDEDSMDEIRKYEQIPSASDYIFDKERIKNIEEAELIWKWCDIWMEKIGYYNSYGESNYKVALTVVNPIKYDTPKPLSDFRKLDGGIVEKAPQSFMYVQ